MSSELTEDKTIIERLNLIVSRFHRRLSQKMMETKTRRLHHAVARVAKLAERLFFGASKHYCYYIFTRGRSALASSAYFISLTSRYVEFCIQICRSILTSFRHNEIFPSLWRGGFSCSLLSGGGKRIRQDANDGAKSEACYEDYERRDEPLFQHIVSLV